MLDDMSGYKPKGRHHEKRLSAMAVRNAPPGFYADGNGLYLKVDFSGAKRWVQRVTAMGKRRDIGLGSAKIISLADAREQAIKNHLLIRSGVDPIQQRRQASSIPTFQKLAEQVHELAQPNWRNPKHGKQWISSLEEYVFPYFGSKRVDRVSSADIRDVLLPIWNSKPETARRVKQRIGAVLKAAIGYDYRTDNPAVSISGALPKHDRSKIKHHKALPYDKVAAALETVRQSEALLQTKLAIEFLVLTATRSGEVRLATWAEIDLANKVWTIPGERMKAKRAHRVPLTPCCLSILGRAKALKLPESDLVFPGSAKGKPISDMTLSKLLKELGVEAVPHGFRSSFRDWANEKTSYPHHVMEMALAHTIKDKAEAAYSRSDLFEKRRKLMGDWSKFVNRT